MLSFVPSLTPMATVSLNATGCGSSPAPGLYPSRLLYSRLPIADVTGYVFISRGGVFRLKPAGRVSRFEEKGRPRAKPPFSLLDLVDPYLVTGMSPELP